MITENLDEFGYREIDEAIDILTAMKEHGLPREFGGDGVRLAFNTYTGDVFLTNDDYEVCIEADGELLMWHTTPNGHEGFLENLVQDYQDDPENWDEEDIEYLRNWGADV